MIPLKDNPTRKFPFWVVTIIALNLYVFYLELTAPNLELFIAEFSLIPAAVNIFAPTTLLSFITSQFLHGGFLHIISNMWFLWIFGDNVEERIGFFVFPLFYLLSGVIGNVFQYLLAPTSDIPIIGASGAIAGILGSYYAFFPDNQVKTLVFILIFVTLIEIPASFILFYWFILQLFSSAVSIADSSSSVLGGVAYFAHIGGFIWGWILSRLAFDR